jgi:tRNA threonylcarbamoyl adenosine modification protein (Sua5/YciO/YrdC/YwlC family)
VKRWLVDREPSPAQIAEIVELIRAGGIVLLPTDTIYGLHALASDARAVDRLARIKGREEGKRFIVIATSADQIESMGASVPSIVRELWPAPLTAILRRGNGTIAARVPKLDWLRALLAKSGPLFSTSANRSGESATSDPDELATDLRNAIDGIVDAGRREGKASAIVDFTRDEPLLIREGDRLFTQELRKTLRKSL